MARPARLAELDLPVPIGAMIAGKYRLEKVLGSGGMGVVAVGRHVRLEQKVAIKMLRPAALLEPEMRERFKREAMAASRMQTEHVARVMDVGETENGVPFIVMEYLRGSDLYEIGQKRGALPIPEAVDYVLQACEALAEAHRCGIVHRDLKPANLFVTKSVDGSPLVKVLDFGISKLTFTGSLEGEPLTQSEVIIGSPFYMSPEQLRNARDVDERADIWALGAVLYKLVSCEVPFRSDTTAELCVAILTEEPRPLEELLPEGAALGAVIQRCLRRDREERIASVVELAEALAPFATDEGRTSISRIVRVAQARTSMPPSSGQPWSGEPTKTEIDRDTNGSALVTSDTSKLVVPMRRWPSAFAGLLFVALLGAGAFYVVRARRPPTAAAPLAPSPALSSVTVPAVPVAVESAVPPASTVPSPPSASASHRRHLVVRGPPHLPPKPAPSAEPSSSPAPTTSDFHEYGGRR